MNSGECPLMVTIMCYAYNHESYIRRCLDGFVNQKANFRFEAIVHDDASTDNTAEIIHEYEINYPDIIKPIYEKENQYSKKDRSLDIIMENAAQGKYIAVCEGDDYWTDDLKLQKQVDVLESHPECLIAFNKVKRVNKNGLPINGTIPYKNHIKEGIVTMEIFANEEFSNRMWTFQTSCFMYRRDMLENDKIERINFFSHFQCGDMPTILWALLHGNGYYIDDIGGCYRVFSGGATTYRKLNKEVNIQSRKDWISSFEFFDKYTYYKYHKHVDRRIKDAEIEIYQLQGRYWKSISKKYWWHYYKNPKRLFSTFLKILNPSFFLFLKKLQTK